MPGQARFIFRDRLAYLAVKPAPQYRASIWHSISAVEMLCKIFSKKNPSIRNTLQKIEDQQIHVNLNVKKGMEQTFALYKHKDETRHSLMDEEDVDLEDARYMLLSSCTLINYICVKADKAGISLA